MSYRIDYPPAIMDLEASGFGADSYPIEIGYVLNNGQRFCTLICPQSEWDHWCKQAEKAHGISRTRLYELGQPVATVASLLNEQLAGRTLYSDAWVADMKWLNRLYEAARMSPSFRLSSLELTLSERQIEIWDQTHQELLTQSRQPRHRASTDAQIIQLTWIATRRRCHPEPVIASQECAKPRTI